MENIKKERRERIKNNLESLINVICRKEMKYLNNYEFEEKSWEKELEVNCNTVSDIVLEVMDILKDRGISPTIERQKVGMRYAYVNYNGKMFRVVELENEKCDSGLNKMLVNYVGTLESVAGIINEDIIIKYEDLI